MESRHNNRLHNCTHQTAGVAPPVVSMAAHTAPFAFLAFLEPPAHLLHACVYSCSEFHAPNHYIRLSIGADTEVRALILALLAPHH